MKWAPFQAVQVVQGSRARGKIPPARCALSARVLINFYFYLDQLDQLDQPISLLLFWRSKVTASVGPAWTGISKG